MTRRDIAILSFKVLSLYAFIKAIDKLPDVIYYIFNSENFFNQTVLLNFLLISVPLLLLTLCALLLWFAAPLMASKVFKSKIPEEKTDVSFADAQAIAFSIAGLLVLAIALPDLVKAAVMHYTIVTQSVRGESPLAGTIVVLLFQIVFGFWLLLGSEGITAFMRSLKKYKKTVVSG